jgi:16S rRNA (adenine1518-N6/adenine1519-N6)-dimethyltransferase
VEIGPGLGALTSLALQSGAKVLAIEKDARLADFLRKRFTSPHLEVLHADALDFDLRTLFAQPRVKCFGNLPYYVSSQLLMKFIEEPSPISLWVFMLQKEMARRLSAKPGASDYGALTLLVQSRYRVDYLRTIPSTVFLPKPEVDSALVRLTPNPRMTIRTTTA